MKKILIIITAVIAVIAVAAYALTRPQPADTRFSGAYTLEDGNLIFITPRESEQLRYRMMDGRSGAFWPVADGRFEGGPGFSDREPVANRLTFGFDPQGRPTEADWQAGNDEPRPLARLPLPERIVTFPSGELTLRGKLVTPAGEGPFPVVVIVHGSESYSGVDHYFEPYLYAAHGIAALAYDKRGTGESEGRYLQNFHVLADDVIAAVQWLRTQDEIDADHIHLAGFSQGGWIAPLAALRDGGIRSVLVGFGVTVPVTEEDRWGYVHALQQAGFGDQEIAAADRINAVIEDIFDRRINRWSELGEMLKTARSEPWYTAVQGSDSILGIMTESKMPLWVIRVYMWWRYARHDDPPFIDRLYDSAPTLAELETPSFWILGGEDSSAPTPRTIEVLEELKAAGKPVDHFVFPEAEHGILRFETREDGSRRYLGYEEEYFPMQIEWLQRQSAAHDDFPEFNRDYAG